MSDIISKEEEKEREREGGGDFFYPKEKQFKKFAIHVNGKRYSSSYFSALDIFIYKKGKSEGRGGGGVEIYI